MPDRPRGRAPVATWGTVSSGDVVALGMARIVSGETRRRARGTSARRGRGQVEQATRLRDEVARARRDPVTVPGARTRGLDKLDRRGRARPTAYGERWVGRPWSRQARPAG